MKLGKKILKVARERSRLGDNRDQDGSWIWLVGDVLFCVLIGASSVPDSQF